MGLTAFIAEALSSHVGASRGSLFSRGYTANVSQISDDGLPTHVIYESKTSEYERINPSFLQGGLDHGIIIRDFAYPQNGASVPLIDMREELHLDKDSSDVSVPSSAVQGVWNDDEVRAICTFFEEPFRSDETGTQSQEYAESMIIILANRRSCGGRCLPMYFGGDFQTTIEPDQIAIPISNANAKSGTSQDKSTSLYVKSQQLTDPQYEAASPEGQDSSSDASWEIVLASREISHRNDLAYWRDKYAVKVKHLKKKHEEEIAEVNSRKVYLQRLVKKKTLKAEEKFKNSPSQD